MGSILGGIGNVVTKAGPGGVDTGGLAQILQGVMNTVTEDQASNQTILQTVKIDIENSLKQAVPAVQSNTGSSQVVKDFQTNLTCLAYIVALQKAIKRAKQPRAFNLETAMNDLWTALNNIKQGNQTNSSTAVTARNTQMIEIMTTMVKTMNDSASASIKNLGI